MHKHDLPSYTTDQVKRAAKSQCWDCGGPSPPYVVNNDVWQEAWPNGEPARRRLSTLATQLFPNARRIDPTSHRVLVSICLCFGCLERRIRRSLRIGDFQRMALSGNRIYLNDGVFLGYRLGLEAAQIIEETRNKKDEGG